MPIGTIVEPGADSLMGMVHGQFIPSPGYEKVRAVFRLFAKGSDHYYRERDALCLTVTTADHEPVHVEFVHIVDFSDELEDDIYQAEFNVSYEFFGNALVRSIEDRPALNNQLMLA